MITKDVGLLPEILLNANPKRKRWSIQFLPASVDAGNMGLVFVAKGFIPKATVGDPQQGEVLNSGAAIEQIEQFPGDPSVYKGSVWVISDTAAQTINYDEETGE